jgi:hypothetical protein
MAPNKTTGDQKERETLFFFLEAFSSLEAGWPGEFVKNHPKCFPTIFCQNWYLHNFYRGKSSPNSLATSVI